MKFQVLSFLLMLSLVPSTLTSAATVETKLTAPDAQQGDELGQAVAIQGDIAVVGAPGAGAAYVFQKTTTGWQLDQKLTKLLSGTHRVSINV